MAATSTQGQAARSAVLRPRTASDWTLDAVVATLIQVRDADGVKLGTHGRWIPAGLGAHQGRSRVPSLLLRRLKPRGADPSLAQVRGSLEGPDRHGRGYAHRLPAAAARRSDPMAERNHGFVASQALHRRAAPRPLPPVCSRAPLRRAGRHDSSRGSCPVRRTGWLGC